MPVSRSATVPVVDVLWVTVKATQLEESLGAITAPALFRAIVPLLNGIDHLNLLRARFGGDKVVPATIAVETERVAPGHIVHRSPFARLNVHSSGKDLLGSTLDSLQKTGFECRFVDDEPTLMWSKVGLPSVRLPFRQRRRASRSAACWPTDTGGDSGRPASARHAPSRWLRAHSSTPKQCWRLA